MILEEIKQLKTGESELRKFGLLVGGVLLALGILFLARGKRHFPWFLWPGVALLLLGLLAPRSLKQIYLAWMSIAIVLGFAISTLILTLFFFLVITPIGLVARLCGRDFLSLKLQRNAKTYWLPRKGDSALSKTDYERQF